MGEENVDKQNDDNKFPNNNTFVHLTGMFWMWRCSSNNFLFLLHFGVCKKEREENADYFSGQFRPVYTVPSYTTTPHLTFFPFARISFQLPLFFSLQVQ